MDEDRWTDVCDDAELRPGAITTVGDTAPELFAVDAVVWRTVDGRVIGCDARCPHQWSHLAYEGVVDGDELVCVSHFWRFDTEGRGTKVNVKGRRDEKAPVPIYPTRVVDGRIQIRLP